MIILSTFCYAAVVLLSSYPMTVRAGRPCDLAFVPNPPSAPSRCPKVVRPLFLSSSTSEGVNLEDEDEEPVEPGKMRVSEIKSELSMRGIDFSDCIDKESLVEKLQEARATGKADPEILTEFNKRKVR